MEPTPLKVSADASVGGCDSSLCLLGVLGLLLGSDLDFFGVCGEDFALVFFLSDLRDLTISGDSVVSITGVGISSERGESGESDGPGPLVSFAGVSDGLSIVPR